MKVVGKVIRAPLKALGLIPKLPKPPVPLKPATRDRARETANLDDELRRRRGGAADMLTGTGGAEASGSVGKTQLG